MFRSSRSCCTRNGYDRSSPCRSHIPENTFPLSGAAKIPRPETPISPLIHWPHLGRVDRQDFLAGFAIHDPHRPHIIALVSQHHPLRSQLLVTDLIDQDFHILRPRAGREENHANKNAAIEESFHSPNPSAPLFIAANTLAGFWMVGKKNRTRRLAGYVSRMWPQLRLPRPVPRERAGERMHFCFRGGEEPSPPPLSLEYKGEGVSACNRPDSQIDPIVRSDWKILLIGPKKMKWEVLRRQRWRSP